MGKYGSSTDAHELSVYQGWLRTCAACGRVFDLANALDADEWANGHDCEDLPACAGCGAEAGEPCRPGCLSHVTDASGQPTEDGQR